MAIKIHKNSSKLIDTTAWLSQADHPPFDRHVHLTYHLGIVFKGTQRFWHQGSQHCLTGQAIATINPDEVHYGHSNKYGDYYHGVLQFSTRTVHTLFNDKKERFFTQSLNTHESFFKRASSLFHRLSQPIQDEEQRTLQAEAIQLLLGDLLSPADAQYVTHRTKPAEFSSLKQFIKTRIL
jgi:hypothetical protein